MSEKGATWDESRMQVMETQERQETQIVLLRDRLAALETFTRSEIAVLQFKSGLWGAAAGVLITLGAIAIQLIMRGKPP